MNFTFEIVYKEEIIETRKYTSGLSPAFMPSIGDKISIEFSNPSNLPPGVLMWEVVDRVFLIFPPEASSMKLQFYVKPVEPTKGFHYF